MNRTLKIHSPSNQLIESITKRLIALNGILGLTDREQSVIATMLSIDLYNPVADRDLVAKTLNMSVPVLNNIIKALVDKESLIRENRNYSYHPLFRNITKLDTFTLQFYA